MTLDVFKADGFSMTSLTAAVNKLPFVPGRVGQMGLFTERGVPTTTVMIEERDGTLALIPSQQRGQPVHQNTRDPRKVRDLRCVHLPQEDTIPADEIQNVRAFGSDNAMEGIETEVNNRFARMARGLDATLEHLRIGAIKGQLLDSDGSTVILDLFTAFNVTQATEIDFDLDNASPAAGAVRKKCHQVQRAIEDVLGAAPYEHIHALARTIHEFGKKEGLRCVRKTLLQALSHTQEAFTCETIPHDSL